MRTNIFILLLFLTSSVCAQTEQTPSSLLPAAPSSVPRFDETISVHDLRIPPKAMKELQRSQNALKSGDACSSARHLERALQIYPDYLEAHNALGARYIQLEEYEKAAAEFQKAIAVDPRVPQPWNNLSVAFFLHQRYGDAESAARRALNLAPQHATSRYMLGAILATERRNPEEAMELLRQTKLEFPDARLLLAQILLRRGAIIEAEEELRAYLALPDAPKRQNVERWLARLTRAPTANAPTESNMP